MPPFLRPLGAFRSLVAPLLLVSAGCGEGAKNPSGGGGLAGATAAGGGPMSGGTSGAGGAAASGGAATTGGSASTGGGNSTLVSCDPTEIVCQPLVPPEPCAEMWAHSVVNGCHGACVPIEECDCAGGRACPDENQYVCWNSAGHCGPYVR